MPEEIAELLKLQIKIVREALESANFHVSTDALIYENEGEEITLYDTLINKESISPDLSLINNSLRIEIERALGTLSDREAEVLRYHFGLVGEFALSIDEIAEILRISRESIRQIKEKAIKKLRNIHKSCLLRSFLGQ
jgi:RNA polymerase primary sigma factor